MLLSFAFAAALSTLAPLAGAGVDREPLIRPLAGAGTDRAPLVRPFAAADLARDSLVVPRGRHVLIDGRVDAAEWEDAEVVLVAPGVQLLLKRDVVYLYVAVRVAEPRVFGANLYLAPVDRMQPYLNLHASAKLGERAGTRAAWPEWRWWNNAGWTANVVRFNAFEGVRFLPDTAKEFQIALSRLPGPDFRLSLDLESAAGVEQPVTAGSTADGLHWYAVRLAP